MTSRNYTLDFTKGILALGVLFLHTQTFIIKVENLTPFLIYCRSMFSLIVPLFFFISGYFFNKSSNKIKNINKLIVLYILYAIITYTFSDQKLFLNKKFFIGLIQYHKGVGYLWFIKFLLIYQMLLTIFVQKNRKWSFIYSLILILVFIVTFSQHNLAITGQKLQFFFFLSGFILSKFKNFYNKYTKLFILSIFFIPLTLNYKYNIFSPSLLVLILFLFIGINSFKMSFDPINIISRNSLFILFIQFFVITIIAHNNFYINNFLIMYLYVVFNILLLVVLKEKLISIIQFLYHYLKQVIIK